MARHSPEARRTRRELDKRLAAVGAASGRDLYWTPQEVQILDLITDAIDKRADLQADYLAATDPKTRVMLSTEIRLLAGAIERLLRRINTELSAPMSRRSQKAQAAARVRWARDADAG